jgi:sporulation protein YunB
MPDVKTYKSRRLPVRIAIAAIIPIILFVLIERALRPIILSLADASARVMAVQAMNNAVFEVMRDDGHLYKDLINVTLDEKGRVSMMSANTPRMNELATQAALTVQRNLATIARDGINIPLGAALGIRLLAGSGPTIRVRVLPVGAVSTEFASEFTSAGINQTRHRIFVQMNTTVQMILPTGAKSASVAAHVPVAESIIVGDVPDSFVDVGNKEDLLLGPRN